MALLATFLLSVLITVFTLGLPTSARADGDPLGDVVRSLTVDITADADGTLHVTETYEWDFGTRNGLGFYRVLVTGMGYEPDPTKMRSYEFSGFAVSSPTGAPADVWVETETAARMTLSIGAPDGSSDTRTGVQTYVLSYEIRGALNAIRGQPDVPDQDELFWNIFTDFDNPIDQVTVNLTGPAPVTNQTCFQGPRGSRQTCAAADPSGNGVTFTGHSVSAGEGFTIVAAWAPGTFSNTDPILVDLPDGFSPTGIDRERDPALYLQEQVEPYLPWASALFVSIAGLVAGLRIYRGRDRIYANVPPGIIQPFGSPEVRMGAEPPVVVQFTPPAGLRPAQASVIVTESASTEAFSATVIDLAVRGYLTIQTEGTGWISKKPNDWRLTATPGRKVDPHGGLNPYERVLLGNLFASSPSVTTKSLSGNFAHRLHEFNSSLRTDSDENGWFRKRGLVPPGERLTPGSLVRRLVVLAGSALVILLLFRGAMTVGEFSRADFISQIGLDRVPWALVGTGLTLALIPLVLGMTAKAAHGRSAYGRAVYDQLRGFRQYLATTDAEQLRWEAGEDIFSKYLPWAMVYGVADRWARVFAQLAASGMYSSAPDWYVGGDWRDSGYYESVSDSVSSFAASGVSDLSFTPGSSGGSGFSGGGGGGSGGGGGGGGGGGR